MIPADAPAVCRILAQSLEAAQWSPADMAQDATAANGSVTKVFVADEQVANEVVGMIVVRTIAAESEVLNMAVSPPWRRRGVGRSLLEAALLGAQSAGARRAFLEVRESNLGARAFYSGVGFTQIGRRRAYYSTPLEDALILSRSID